MLRVLCVGAGYFARFHHDAWARHPDAELVAVADPDTARAAEVGVSAYPSLAAALEAVSPDIIDLIVSPGAHDAMVREALEARPKAIICQKPFGSSLEEAAGLAMQRMRRVCPS
ncbi:MAG: Gfo/Idh/MocA family oxidoreductase [Rhodobacteraceae bacterium]|nr:Gfo/Idh/MocA family oxidoreductase [Paracoccaceae bacterium]